MTQLHPLIMPVRAFAIAVFIIVSASANGEVAQPEKPTETQTTAKATIDPRLNELQKRFSALLEQARARKITYLKAARLYRERFNDLFPEQASNDLMNEYLAYMATV
jgi:hypothetical protein